MSSQSTPTHTVQGNSINLFEILYIVRQRWRTGLGIGLACATIGALLMLNQAPRYRSSATPMVEINPEKMLQLSDVGGDNQGSRIYDTIINSYLERLRSRSMGTVVLETMQPHQLALLRQHYPDAPSYQNDQGEEFPRSPK